MNDLGYYQLNIRLLAFYLERLGFKRVDTNRKGIDAFVEDVTHDAFEIYLPKNHEIPRAELMLKDAVTALSFYEDREAALVLKSLIAIDFDLHNYRIKEDLDSISLPLMENLLLAAKFTFKESAKIEHTLYLQKLSQYQKAKEKSPKEESDQFVSGCRFAHTWHGSFGVTLETPLSIPSLGMNSDIPEPLGRKASKRIMSGMKVVAEAVNENSPNYILDHCENDILMFSSMPQLQEVIGTSTIEYSLNLSPVVKHDNSDAGAFVVPINSKILRYIERALDQIRLPDDELELEVVGFPETISASKESLLSEVEGVKKVVVKGFSIQVPSITIRLELTLEEYRKAIKAQGEVKMVRVGCKVRKKVRGWDVLKLHYFRLDDEGG